MEHCLDDPALADVQPGVADLGRQQVGHLPAQLPHQHRDLQVERTMGR